MEVKYYNCNQYGTGIYNESQMYYASAGNSCSCSCSCSCCCTCAAISSENN